MARQGAFRWAKNQYKRALRKLFELGQYAGFDVLPRHFYSSIPDIRELKRTDGWRRRLTLESVNGAAIEEQRDFLRRVVEPWREQLQRADVYARAIETAGEVGYSRIDAQFLHCFIRAFRPAKVVQVGCGCSTGIILNAAGDEDAPISIRCIEPYPSRFLRDADRAGRVELVAQRAQAVDLSLLTDLAAGDLLFVDSTHTVKPGSEVNRIVLEALPRLAPGVFVHFHDIYLPYEHQVGLLSDELFFSVETTLLTAFLAMNPGYAIASSLAMLHHGDPGLLAELFAGYQPAPSCDGLRTRAGGDWPTAVYLRRV